MEPKGSFLWSQEFANGLCHVLYYFWKIIKYWVGYQCR